MFKQRWQVMAGLAFIASVPMTFLGSVSHVDALEHYGWTDGAAIADARPGQFYVVDQDGTVKEPLCSITMADFSPQQSASRGIRFKNVLGMALPDVLARTLAGLVGTRAAAEPTAAEPGPPYILEWREIERSFLPVSLMLSHNRRILAERDLEGLAKNATSEELAEALRFENCATAVVTAIKAGLNVCQLNEVVTNMPKDRILAVDFASLCLASETDTTARRFPGPPARPLLVEARKWLIEAEPL